MLPLQEEKDSLALSWSTQDSILLLMNLEQARG